MSAFDDPEVDLPPARVREMVDAGEAQLVDVREPYEREAGYIPGSEHIELEHLASGADRIDRDKPVIFQCRLGARSAMATQAFRASGFKAYNLAGGIQAWADEGLPMEPVGTAVVADH